MFNLSKIRLQHLSDVRTYGKMTSLIDRIIDQKIEVDEQGFLLSCARARVRFYEKQCQSADVDRLEAKSIIILAFVHNLIRSLVGVVFSIDILMNFMLLLLSR